MKEIRFEIKTVGASDSGEITGLAATYGNVDRQDDVIMPGAFTKTLRENGGQVPLLYQHDQRAPIGLCTLTDTPAGLVVEAQLVLDVPEAKKAWALLKAGVLKSFSIGYTTVKSSMRGAVRVLEELTLLECSIVTIPANELATVTGLKADQARAADESVELVYALSMLAMTTNLKSMARQMRAGHRV